MFLFRWLFPFIGHMGICTSTGIIRDFAGPYFVSVSNDCSAVRFTYVIFEKILLAVYQMNIWTYCIFRASNTQRLEKVLKSLVTCSFTYKVICFFKYPHFNFGNTNMDFDTQPYSCISCPPLTQKHPETLTLIDEDSLSKDANQTL